MAISTPSLPPGSLRDTLLNHKSPQYITVDKQHGHCTGIGPWIIKFRRAHFYLSLTFTINSSYKKVRPRSKVSSSKVFSTTLRTIVNYSLLYFKTMVPWNFDLLWKTMVLWKKLWYYGKNYGTIPKTMEL